MLDDDLIIIPLRYFTNVLTTTKSIYRIAVVAVLVSNVSLQNFKTLFFITLFFITLFFITLFFNIPFSITSHTRPTCQTQKNPQ
jgi:hypothetical protein